MCRVYSSQLYRITAVQNLEKSSLLQKIPEEEASRLGGWTRSSTSHIMIHVCLPVYNPEELSYTVTFQLSFSRENLGVVSSVFWRRHDTRVYSLYSTQCTVLYVPLAWRGGGLAWSRPARPLSQRGVHRVAPSIRVLA